MKKEEVKNVRGSMDYGEKDAIIRNYISKTLQETFEKYGYTPLETSILCYYELLALKYDEDNDILKEIYQVADQGKRKLALRYDLTVPFAKYIAANTCVKLPYKRYEIGKVFRDGPIKKGRMREFIQCDVDCVGIDGQLIEAEIISLAVEGYKKLGIDVVIQYNNRKLMNGIIEACEIETEKIGKVITIIDKMEKLTEQELIDAFVEIGLSKEQIENLFKYLKQNLTKLQKIFKNTSNDNLIQGLKELNDFTTYIAELGLSSYIKFSPTLARGQEYYTGTVFEVYIADGSLKSSIGGGGRYDKMIGEFIKDGKAYPAVGISFGLDVIFEILKEKQIGFEPIEVYIIPDKEKSLSLKIAEELRKNNIKVDIEMTNLKLKKALKIASEKKIPIVVILGENELKDRKISIKDMRNNLQITENLDNYLSTIKQILSIGTLEYKILNPGGNITSLVKGCEYTVSQKKLINTMLMEKYPEVEQVGFLSDKTNRLEMAGGEFCMNASRCAVYEYSKEKQKEIEFSVSGTNNTLIGKRINDKEVEIQLPINRKISEIIEEGKDTVFAKLDGILIAIVQEEASKKLVRKLKENEEAAKKELKQFMIEKIQTKEKAIGLMLLEKVSGKTKINPVVWVKEIDTVFYETACGSGSLGTALYNFFKNKETKINIVQPSGYLITIELKTKGEYIESAIIRGNVKEIEN